uniref:Somatostatin receptor type 4 n=1 Tax=Lygus hesperus TaxID=30085 RepID=A0A0A9YNR1_LYGHE
MSSANATWFHDSSTYPNGSRNETDLFCSTFNQPTLVIFAQILYALVCIVGLLGNSLVIYVVLRFSKMQTVTNMYIVNLAVADECFLIGIPFLIATMSLELWPFGHVMCKIYMATTSINQFTSSIFLTIMSADRYVAVCHPITAPKMRTPFISKIVSLVAWTASAVLMVPVFMYAKLEILGDPEQSSCNIIWPESEKLTGQTAFTLYTFVLGFFIPLVLIFCFYFLVIRKLQTVGPKNKSKEKKKSHRKVTKLVLTVITVYVLCWLPYWIMQVALIFTPPNQCQSRITVTVFLIAGCLSYSNSAMNPILYAFLSDNFKKSFMKACTCAAGTDVNATLHLENSVFPRRTQRGGSERRAVRGNRDDAPDALLVSRTDHSTTALTSRSNVTVTSDTTTPVKNGVKLNVTPTEL